MFRFLQWILIFGAFAGLGLRASGAHFDDCRPDPHELSCCDGGEAAGHSDEHCPDCPPVPHHHQGHHHGECCHAPSWLSVTGAEASLFPPFVWAFEREEANERPPEEPVLPFDKPPLI